MEGGTTMNTTSTLARTPLLVLLAAALLTLISAFPVKAHGQDDYTLEWWTAGVP
jgi:hypothetical protein